MVDVMAASPLLGRQQQRLYGRLVRAFPGHVILSQVALSRVLGLATAAGRHCQWVADFMICRPDFTAVAVVECDECVAPKNSVRGKNHRRKDLRLEAAGIKVVHIAAADIPDEAALKALVAALPLSSSSDQLMRRVS